MGKIKQFKQARQLAEIMIHIKNCPECTRRQKEITECYKRFKGSIHEEI